MSRLVLPGAYESYVNSAKERQTPAYLHLICCRIAPLHISLFGMLIQVSQVAAIIIIFEAVV